MLALFGAPHLDHGAAEPTTEAGPAGPGLAGTAFRCTNCIPLLVHVCCSAPDTATRPWPPPEPRWSRGATPQTPMPLRLI